MYSKISRRKLMVIKGQAIIFGLILLGFSSANGQEDAAPTHQWRMPVVVVVENGASRPLPLEKAQLAQTKTKATSMASLAGDTALNQAFQAGIGDATMATASHINSGIGNSALGQTGSILSGMMARRKASVTYVWGVPNPASPNVMQTAMPQFATDFSHAPGVNPDEYQPAIVRLTPTQNTCRLVGATEGKEDARSDPAADWQIYSHFVEDPIAIKLQRVEAGKYTIAPASELLPGEYALVLRPTSRTRKFSGGEVARAQGDGLMFDAVWTFQVPDSAQ